MFVLRVAILSFMPRLHQPRSGCFAGAARAAMLVSFQSSFQKISDRVCRCDLMGISIDSRGEPRRCQALKFPLAIEFFSSRRSMAATKKTLAIPQTVPWLLRRLHFFDFRKCDKHAPASTAGTRTLDWSVAPGCKKARATNFICSIKLPVGDDPPPSPNSSEIFPCKMEVRGNEEEMGSRSVEVTSLLPESFRLASLHARI